MKLSKKITILISVIFIIIFASIASRYFVGKHFEKKFSQRPPPGVIVEIVDNSEFFEKIETFSKLSCDIRLSSTVLKLLIDNPSVSLLITTMLVTLL